MLTRIVSHAGVPALQCSRKPARDSARCDPFIYGSQREVRKTSSTGYVNSSNLSAHACLVNSRLVRHLAPTTTSKPAISAISVVQPGKPLAGPLNFSWPPKPGRCYLGQSGQDPSKDMILVASASETDNRNPKPLVQTSQSTRLQIRTACRQSISPASRCSNQLRAA